MLNIWLYKLLGSQTGCYFFKIRIFILGFKFMLEMLKNIEDIMSYNLSLINKVSLDKSVNSGN